jgi:hypothetical protein
MLLATQAIAYCVELVNSKMIVHNELERMWKEVIMS